MMEKWKYGLFVLVVALFTGISLVAQDTDEDSLLAEEDLALTDSIEGDLPADDNTSSDDNLLSDLLADDSGSDDAVADDIPLDALNTKDDATDKDATNALDALDNSADDAADNSADDALADLLGGDDIADDTPVADVPAKVADTPVAPAPAPAPAKDAGGDDAIKDLGLDSLDSDAITGTPEKKDGKASDDSIDDLVGELLDDDEPGDDKTAAPEVEEPALIDEPAEVDSPLVTEEPVVVEEPTKVETPVAEPEKGVDKPEDKSADMDSLINELTDDSESDLDLGDLKGAEEPTKVEAPEKAVVPSATEVPAKAVEIVDAPPVDIADDEPKKDDKPFVDDMALDDNLIKSLAAEARADLAKGASSAKSKKPVADTLDLPDLGDDTDAGEPSSEVPATESLAIKEPVAINAAPEVNAPTKSPEVAAFEEAERLKRIAVEEYAKRSIELADAERKRKHFASAILKYKEALKHLPYREDLRPIRERAIKGLGDASYQRALSFERMGEFDKAKAAAMDAAKYSNPRGKDAVRRIQSKIEKPQPVPPKKPKHRWNQEDYIETQKQVKAWLRQGREALLTGEYERAILNFESALARDPENKEAMRLKRNAEQKRLDRSKEELDGTRVSMMTDVLDAWSQKRKYGEYETPIDDLVGKTGTTTSKDDKQREEVIKKMNTIRIPEVNFRQANIRDVVQFLHQQSVEADPSENPDERKGVNIILKMGDSDKPAATEAAPPDPWGEPGGGDALDAGAGGSPNDAFITFSALDITLKEALDIVVDIANLKYVIRGNIVKIMPKNSTDRELEHRMYNVLSTAITRLQTLSTAVANNQAGGNRGNGGDFLEIEGSQLGGQEVDLKGFFQEMGVDWPEGSSIKYVRGLGKLVVANTLENLTVFEKVLGVLNVVPYQIEIEARFVEVSQTDIDSLGLEWLLNDNWELAEKKSDAGKPLFARERIIMEDNAGGGGFTRGNRFITDLGGARKISDDLMKFTSILTNPELSVILHAVQQSGHSDLLSAPKVTTQSGQQATIKVVTEYIYPTEYTLIEAQGSGGDNAGIAPPAVEPGSFETREVGVILDVLPEVSPDGQMINLTLSPEVVTEPVWHDYGYDYFLGNMGGGVVTTHLRMEQPFFHTRSLQTNLLIYNGATVVMGGMITEVREDVDDRIPILGDIPIIGHLFRSKYEASEKRNLLIFVTARLVDPSGRPLNSEKFGIDKTIAEKIAKPSANTATDE